MSEVKNIDDKQIICSKIIDIFADYKSNNNEVLQILCYLIDTHIINISPTYDDYLIILNSIKDNLEELKTTNDIFIILKDLKPDAGRLEADKPN